MHIYQGNQPYFVYPRVMGHELSAEVVTAPKDSGLTPGDAVYIVPYLHCGHCVACRAGRTNCCTTLKVLGVHIDGGMCEYLALPASALFRADGIGLDAAAMGRIPRYRRPCGKRVPGSRPDSGRWWWNRPHRLGVAIFAQLAGADVTVLDGRPERLAFCTDVVKVAHA